MKLIDIYGVFNVINKVRRELLKIDIEGGEYELLDSDSFRKNATRIQILCIEFHHRWDEFGPAATHAAAKTLHKLGFECVWQARERNEEFTFINTRWAS